MIQQNFKLDASNAKDTNELLRDLANNLIIGVYIVQDGKFLFTNSVFQKLVFYSEKELLGMDSLSLVYPEDRDRARENAVKMLKGEISSPYEFRYVNKGGESLWVMETVTSVTYQERRATLGSFMDITERERVEEKLRRTEERMRVFSNALPDLGLVLDENGRYIEVINNIENLMYKEAVSLIGQTLHEVMPEEVANLGLRAVRRAIKTGHTQSIEYQLDVPLGLRQFEARLSPILPRADVSDTVAVIIRDITDRKQTETKYRQLLEDINDGYGVIQEGKYVFANRRLGDIFGCEPGQVIGKSFIQFAMPNDRQAAMEQYERVMRGEETVLERHEAMAMKVDGTPIIIETSRNAIQYESKPAFGIILRDITDRKQAEMALQESETRYRTLFEKAAEGILIADIETRKQKYANPAICRMLGYSQEELIGMTVGDIHPKDSLEVASAEFDAQARGDKQLSTLPCLRKDGTVIYMDINATKAAIDGRECNIGFFTDITDRKQAETKYRQLLEDMSDGYAVIQDGKYVFVNRRFGEIFECEPEQILGKPVGQSLSPDAIRSAGEQYGRVIRGEEAVPVPHEVVVNKRGKATIIIETSVKPIQYEGKPALSVVVRDITEHKQAEAKYRQLLEDMSDGYAVIQEGKYIFANRRFGEIFKYDLKQILGKSIAKFMMLEDRQAGMEQYERVIRGEEAPATQYEGETIIGDGTTITIEASNKPIQYEGKPAIGIIVRDITEHKRAEKKLQELYQLEIKMRESLEAERRRRIEFTRVLVHELKTPLTPMLASSQLLLEELHGEETLLRLAKNMSQGTLNLSNRVDELLDLMRGETGILRLEIESVDLLPLLKKAADAIAPMASSNGHSLILDLPPFLPSVRADQGRLLQIILNLLNNASKFTPKGGEITLRARKNDDALVVEVQDTGHGIAKEDHERIFDPYHRVENDRQRFSGMGLGLALCKKLVELHGGQIWVRSRQGEGSTFSFSLPLEDH